MSLHVAMQMAAEVEMFNEDVRVIKKRVETFSEDTLKYTQQIKTETFKELVTHSQRVSTL